MMTIIYSASGSTNTTFLRHKPALVIWSRIVFFMILVVSALLVSCTRPRPNNVEDICSIFYEYPDWYREAKQVEARWGVPIPVQMSIIYYESSFDAKARPPGKRFLWFTWARPTSAYGYSQALNNTWKDYQRQTGNGHSKRQSFDDACDFIGWYSHQVNHKLGINPTNTYALYLAYHEGMGGYASHSYIRKPWLIRYAHKVSAKSLTYQRQLMMCEGNLG